MDSIGKINAILMRRGMTGSELSRTIGVSSGVYSQWNKHMTRPSKKNLVRIADALGVDIEEILPDEESSALPEEDAIRKRLYSILEELDPEALGKVEAFADYVRTHKAP